MPLFGLIKKKKKTKDQPSDITSTTTTPTDNTSNSSAAQDTTTSSTSHPVTQTTSNTSSSSKEKKLNKVKSDSSNLTPVRTISHKTPNPFTAPVPVPKSPTLTTPEVDENRMYSSSPFSTSPQNTQPTSQSQPSSHPQQLQNVVTGQYNAPPTPPSTARSGSIDDKLDTLPSIGSQSYQHDLKHPQPQQGYNATETSSDAMIASSSGLLTPVPNDRVIPSRYPTTQSNAVRSTKGKYAIVDFSIQRTLGTGSFGRVHLVQSRHNSRFYAIKVPPLRYFTDNRY
jgi:protein kinase A